MASIVLLASLACALVAAILIGEVMLHQQMRFDIARIQETYKLATSDRLLSKSTMLIGGTPTVSKNELSTISAICHTGSVGMALVPSYATTDPRANRPIFDSEPSSPPTANNPVKFGIGLQNSQQVSSVISSPQTDSICGPNISNSTIVYIEPLPGSNHSVDLLLTGNSPSWITFIKAVGLGTIVLFVAVLAIAAIALRFVLKQLRAATLGYSPVQLAAILEEQEALLQGISEGVAGCDPEGNIRFFNSEAKRILNLPKQSIGRPLRVLVRGARLRQVISGEISGRDLPVIVRDSVVIVNHIKVRQGEVDLGYVITMRDQTEWEGLLKELDSLVGMTNALRAQAHEFSNKLHTIVGLIEIGQSGEAVAFATEIAMTHTSVSTRLHDSIGDSMISAMLLAKSASASERAVDLIIEEESSINGQIISPSEILSVLGNLIDNAIDAASSKVIQLGWKTSERGWVKVLIRDSKEDLVIEVSDSGPGIADDILPNIFTDGFSTKESRYGARRGLGLALVKQVITHSGGTVTVTNSPGAHFSIRIPGAILYRNTEDHQSYPYTVNSEQLESSVGRRASHGVFQNDA